MHNEPVPDPAPEESTQKELLPIARIGVETVLSRMPIHNLAKKGRVNIQITRRDANGQVALNWEVSHNERYGQPRQLAYKLDTLVINRRIDEEGRPIPRFIRLGSLNNLCSELGSNKNELKRAIRQNATTSINAKLIYKGTNGSERELEALFTRYSVYFTGEKLPDGRTADAIYIELNGPYREVLNNAPIRPLNYAYLKSLPPAPQRFYEIISGRIYAALKLKIGNPVARIPYSEFCTYSALTRHDGHTNFRVQMAKILRPHLQSGYIAKAQYEPTTDYAGNADWMMCFQPGPRARAEYMTFGRKRNQLEVTSRPQAPESENPLLEELTKRGIAKGPATKILAAPRERQKILDQLEWGDFLIQSQPGKYRNTAGFYVYLLTENVNLPATFESSRQRKQRAEAQTAVDQAYLATMKLENAYEVYRSAAVDEFIRDHVTESDLAAVTERKRKHLAASFKTFRLLPAETIQSMLRAAVSGEIAQRVKILSFTAFVDESQAPTR